MSEKYAYHKGAKVAKGRKEKGHREFLRIWRMIFTTDFTDLRIKCGIRTNSSICVIC